MQNEKAPSTDNTETNPVAGSENPWAKMPEEVPPFNDGEKPSTETEKTTEETNEETTESDKPVFEKIDYRDIDRIDISTDQGKAEWLNGLVENANAWLENEQKNIIHEKGLDSFDEKEQEEFLENNDTYQKNQRSLDVVKRQSEILENLDINDNGGVLGALEQRMHSFAEAMNDNENSKEDQEDAFENWNAVANLHSIMSAEMARRDPKYFGQEEMGKTLELEVAQAERQVEQTMTDGYIGEDGFFHKGSNGEKFPSAVTEDAKIDLERAKQDVETFDLLIHDYNSANNYIVPHAIKKEDFAPTIDKFIENHTAQINQLIAESKTLAKDTPEYEENEAKRKKLASERSSAKRLEARYFSASKA